METIDDRRRRQLAAARAARGNFPRREKKDTGGSGADDDLIPDVVVARDLYQVDPITLTRWDEKTEQGKLDFPPPVEINGRRYRKRGELRQFNMRHVVRRANEQVA
jgi:hypothetical protein